ncbi:MAG: GNAT family N-acetyltransferase [Lactobacillaceae bacterium]
MIRPVVISDIEDLCEINHQELGYEYPLDKSLIQLRKILQDTDHHYLAAYESDDNRKFLGYIHAEVYDEIYNEPTLNVLALAVSSEAQHLGIGTQLIKWLEALGTEKGFKSIRLNSGMNRTNAHSFYEHIGFVHIKDQKKFVKSL